MVTQSGGFPGDVTSKRNLRKIQPGEGRELRAGERRHNFRQRKDVVVGVDWGAIRKLHVSLGKGKSQV